MLKVFRFISPMIVAVMLLAACAPAATPAPAPTAVPPTAAPAPTATEAPKTIVDIAVADGRFTTLVSALDAAGLVDTLQGAGPFTVFAPTDDAFAKLPAGTVDALLKDPEALKKVLLYHVVAGDVMAADVSMLTEANTVEGANVMVKVMDGKVYINDAQVIMADIKASNGVIHVIDTVLLPPKDIVDTAVADGRFTTLVAAIQAAGLVDTLKGPGPFTVFAPTDDAFAKLPAGTVDALLQDIPTLKNILLYHVVGKSLMAADVITMTHIDTLLGQPLTVKVDGDKVYINDAQIILTDIQASNGVIHVIDTVLLPKDKDIVDTAIADGRFTTLVAAVQAAGLVDTLKGSGPFTVFAPTDDAFAKLPAGTVAALLKDPEALKNILLYHVVEGRVYASDVVKLTEAKTVQGTNVTVKVEDGKVYINDAQVILTDIETSNGVIHVIDTVLIPPKDIVDTAIADGRFKTLVAAVQAAGLVDTLKGPGPFTVFAPTDTAFAKLPAGTVEALLKDPAALKDILLYHVVPGKVMAADVVKLTEAKTAEGKSVTIKVMDGKVYVNDAQVIITDIVTGNGVIHVIDTVLLPPK